MTLKKKQLHHEAGFTLIEVLFALAILSIALLALTQAGFIAVRLQSRIHRHLQASWIHQNAQAAMQLHLHSTPAQGNTTEGSERSGLGLWHWEAKNNGSGPDGLSQDMSFTVYAPHHGGQWVFHDSILGGEHDQP